MWRIRTKLPCGSLVGVLCWGAAICFDSIIFVWERRGEALGWGIKGTINAALLYSPTSPTWRSGLAADQSLHITVIQSQTRSQTELAGPNKGRQGPSPRAPTLCALGPGPHHSSRGKKFYQLGFQLEGVCGSLEQLGVSVVLFTRWDHFGVTMEQLS